MTVFLRGDKWVAKFVKNGRQHWVRGGPWPTRSAALRAEAEARSHLAEAATDKRRAAPHTVYMLYADSELVYVGITGAWAGRLGDHRRDKPWWPEVTHATFTHLGSYQEADEEETRLIREHRPRYNKAKVPEELPSGMATAAAVGEYLHFKPATILKLADEGLLPVAGQTDRGTRYFDLDEVEAWIRAGKAERLPVDPAELAHHIGSRATNGAPNVA